MKEKSRMAGGRYIQNQQLEEIRLKEDNLDRTMKKWMADKDQREKETKAEEERIQMERVSNITYVIIKLVYLIKYPFYTTKWSHFYMIYIIVG